MKKNTLITFGEAIRTKYESEKNDDPTGFYTTRHRQA